MTDPQCHGGIAAGDIDGDGDTDVARVDRWLENADGRGETWIERRTFDFGKVGPWGNAVNDLFAAKLPCLTAEGARWAWRLVS